MTTEEQKIIYKNAAEIVTAGWHQGNLYNANKTSFCLLGALREAIKRTMPGAKDWWKDIDFAGLYDNLHRLGECPTRTLLSEWNDAPERTQQEVVDLLLKAAE